MYSEHEDRLSSCIKQLNIQSLTVRSRTAAQKLTYLRELVYQVLQVEPVYISGQSQRADGQTKTLSGQALLQAQQHFNLFTHAELRIQVSYHYHPCMIRKRVSIVEEVTDRQEDARGSSPLSLRRSESHSKERHWKGAERGGEENQQGGRDEYPLTLQEKRQYEWYVREFQKAAFAVDPQAERERISMIMTALFPPHSHMPPERSEKKVGRKKGPQGETPGSNRGTEIGAADIKSKGTTT